MYGADPNHPRGTVAYSDEPMRRMIDASGLKLKRPYVKGWWSGAHDDAEDGQDAAILDGEISPLELITVADIAGFVEEYAIVF